jgi:hypothetical protein
VLFARSWLRHIDLWVFPSLAFIAAFRLADRFVPSSHPMDHLTVLNVALGAATLTLMLLRPVGRSTRRMCCCYEQAGDNPDCHVHVRQVV